jgi:superfamily II RNA helicase
MAQEISVTLDKGQWRRVIRALDEYLSERPDNYNNALVREYKGEMEDCIGDM